MKSPVITGFLNPRIYLPIHIISDHMKTGSKAAGRTTCYAEIPEISGGSEPDGLRPIRYMLLHELQHYRHKDAFAGCLMTLAGILYWFNPVVWIALREMRNDREIACDTSVLNMLETDLHEDYGRTLIDFAGKLSRPAFPFAAGLGGNMAQMKRRILNITAYEKPTIKRRLAGITAFLMITALLLGMAPVLSANGSESDYYRWDDSHKNITDLGLASYFQGYEGSFVLYDMRQDMWSVYDIERAAFRVSPDSTYKIYDALFGLEEGVITPEDSYMEWDREVCPIKEWNMDQTLRSAMRHSVNWYFMEIDECLGASAVDRYTRQIGYGNEDTDSRDVPCWLESSLKISPIEQVELLRKFYENSLGFSDRNVDAVKDAIRISSSASGTLYGKTGTGRIEGMDVNGWFVGYVET